MIFLVLYSQSLGILSHPFLKVIHLYCLTYHSLSTHCHLTLHPCYCTKIYLAKVTSAAPYSSIFLTNS